MLLPLLLAGLLSCASAFLTHQYGWPASTLSLLLIVVGVWCDVQLIWGAIGYMRQVWMAFDYAPARRHYPAPLAGWVRRGYLLALAFAAAAGVFGAALGGSIGWFRGGASSAADLALLLGATYALPIALAAPFLAHRYAQARRFVAERLDQPPV